MLSAEIRPKPTQDLRNKGRLRTPVAVPVQELAQHFQIRQQSRDLVGRESSGDAQKNRRDRRDRGFAKSPALVGHVNQFGTPILRILPNLDKPCPIQPTKECVIKVLATLNAFAMASGLRSSPARTRWFAVGPGLFPREMGRLRHAGSGMAKCATGSQNCPFSRKEDHFAQRHVHLSLRFDIALFSA